MESPGGVDAVESRLFTGPFIALAIADLAWFTSAGMLLLLTPLFARGPLGADPVGVGIGRRRLRDARAFLLAALIPASGAIVTALVALRPRAVASP